MGERGVVARAVRLADPHRLAAHLDDERLGDRRSALGRGDAEAAVGQPVEVHRGAGEGHRRVQRQGEDVLRRAPAQHADAVAAAGVDDDLPGLPARRSRSGPATSGAASSSGTASSRARPRRRPSATRRTGRRAAGSAARVRLASLTPRRGDDPVPGPLRARPRARRRPGRRRRRRPAAGPAGPRECSQPKRYLPDRTRTVLPVEQTPWRRRPGSDALYGPDGFYRRRSARPGTSRRPPRAARWAPSSPGPGRAR